MSPAPEADAAAATASASTFASTLASTALPAATPSASRPATATVTAIATAAAALPPAFPLAAMQGQPQLVRALLLAALDPALGGVLIEGPRGTAKSTAARALADLLAPAPFVTLPLGASLEAVTGTLDLQQALQGHTLRLAPGLLARAHGGVLYVDEINLLPDALVDVLLDAAASGVNVVERDGISHAHAARFVLVGTMNPEEGELRPQLRDRLGLSLALTNLGEPRARQAAVRARLAFDADPERFLAAHATAQAQLAAQLAQARARLALPGALPCGDAVHEAVSTACLQAQVDGLRADLVMLRAARTLAAWEGASAVDCAHVAAVAEFVLRHRRRAEASTPGPTNARTRADAGDQTQGVKPDAEQGFGPDDGSADRHGDQHANGTADQREDRRDAGCGAAALPPDASDVLGDGGGGGGDRRDEGGDEGGDEGDWGALPPQPVAAPELEALRAPALAPGPKPPPAKKA